MPSVAESPVAPTDTVTVVAPVRAPPSSVPVTVTTVPPPFSATARGFAVNSTSVDALSSSRIVSSVPLTLKPDTGVLPVTETSSPPSPTVSLVGVSVNVAVPEGCPASIVSVRSATAA